MLYIFDLNEQLKAVLKNDGTACPYYDAVHTEKLTGENTFTFTVPANHPDSQFVVEGNLVAFKDLDANWQLFEIKRVTDVHGDSLTRTAFCEHAYYELIDDFIEDVRPYDVSAYFALTQALSGTRWQPGNVADLGLNSTNFYYQTVLSAVQKVASVWGGELQFRVVVEGGIISARYVDLLARRGADTGKQFVYSKDIKSIEREVDLTNVATALYGRGKGVEVGEGYGRRLDFADVVWSTASGDPVDKPAGQEWVGDPKALARWGRPGGRHRFGVFEDPEETDPAKLLQKTWEALQKENNPRITYRLDVADLERLSGYGHEKVRLGDTVRCIDRKFNPPLLVEARVIEINRDLLQPENTHIILGNFAPTITDENLKVQETVKVVRDRQGVWDTATPFTGPVPTSWLDGIIDTLQNEVRAGNGSVTLTDDNGILIVDNPDNPTKALRLLGGLLAIANEKDPVTGEWVWRTFGTGDGFTADEINAGEINTSLVKILGNTNFYWDGDYLYIVNPENGNQQIRLSKEGIRFTRDGGQTWRVAMDFDGIRMEGQSQDGHTYYTGDGVKVYDEQGSLVGHLGSFEALGNQTATFTRNSVAYKQDGSQVAANVPRFEQGKFGQAVMVEEGTTNLIGAPRFYATSGEDSSVTYNNHHIKIDFTSGVDSGYKYYYPVINVSPNTNYTFSFKIVNYIKAPTSSDNFIRVLSGDNQLPVLGIKTFTVNDVGKTIFVTFNSGNNTQVTPNFIAHANIGERVILEVKEIQLEAKPYPTSFTPSTRSDETLTIPTAGVLNPQEGTVELTYIPFLDSSKVALGGAMQDWWWIFGAGSAESSDELRLAYAGGAWHIRVGGSSDTTYTASFAAGDKISLTLAWKQGVGARFFINGVKVATFTPSNFNVGTIVSIGYSYLWNGYRCNGLIDDLRISSRARTDEEIAASYASGQPLPADEYTTYKINFDGHLRPIERKYGLWVAGGEIGVGTRIAGKDAGDLETQAGAQEKINSHNALQSPHNLPSYCKMQSDGIKVYDSGNDLRCHLGQYASGKYGLKVADGEIYSTRFQTGDENSKDYIALVPPKNLVVMGSNFLTGESTYQLAIIATGGGGTIYFFDNATDEYNYVGSINATYVMDGFGDIPDGNYFAVGARNRNLLLNSASRIYTGKGLHVHGNLSCSGTKPAIQATESYGLRALYARESPELKFVEEGIAELIEGQAIIELDPMFLETIEPNTPQTPWLVMLTPYDEVSLYVAEIGTNYIVVKEQNNGVNNARFAWSLSAIRKGYARVRMEQFDAIDEEILNSGWEDEIWEEIKDDSE